LTPRKVSKEEKIAAPEKMRRETRTPEEKRGRVQLLRHRGAQGVLQVKKHVLIEEEINSDNNHEGASGAWGN